MCHFFKVEMVQKPNTFLSWVLLKWNSKTICDIKDPVRVLSFIKCLKEILERFTK